MVICFHSCVPLTLLVSASSIAGRKGRYGQGKGKGKGKRSIATVDVAQSSTKTLKPTLLDVFL